MGIDKPQIVHRAGGLKQTNKLHKHGKHRSKGTIDVATKGRVSLKSLSRKHKKEMGRDARKHQADQLRRNKREDMFAKKRGLGGSSESSAPFLVCLLPLDLDIEAESALEILKMCDPEAVIDQSPSGVTHINLIRFKKRYSFVIPAKDNKLEILDTLKVCDTVLFIISASTCLDGSEVVDEWGAEILSSIRAQGIPTSNVALMDLESIQPKKRNEAKQLIQKQITKWFPDEKLLALDKEVDGLNVLRKIGNQKQKSVHYRDKRAHIYAESFQYIEDSTGTDGTLKIQGYLRGSPLSVNGLVHIPGLGDFQMANLTAYNNHDYGSNNRQVVTYSAIADPKKQESLLAENEDLMDEDVEQTWPDDEDYRLATEENKTKKLKKKVPKGWSEHQAAWIPDIDAESFSESSGEEDDEEMDKFSNAHSEIESEEDDYETVCTESEVAIADEKYDEEMDVRDEINELAKVKAARSDAMFPDEIDTPQNISARERFRKYRGLESFRTSPWDPKENVTADYTRIFQFENFDRMRRRICKEQSEMLDGAMPGWYVSLEIKNVTQFLWKTFIGTKVPIIVYGLLPHEHKMSVLNVLLKRTNDYDVPIKSKERLIFQCGYRRFIVNPIFSEHTNGGKHKFLRYYQPLTTCVATFFAPIQFPPSPVLCFKEVDNKLILVASGNLLSVNPDRMIIKRVVLSGHPLKVNKRSAVVRFMFFNREDIKYFQAVKLRTKYGRIGHIKEPLGTHGHMKVSFNGQLKSQDTILLNLYKRVFPKWTYEDCITSCTTEDTDAAMQE